MPKTAHAPYTRHTISPALVVDRPTITDDTAAALVASVYGSQLPDAMLPIRASYLVSLVERAFAFDKATARLQDALDALSAAPPATDKEPCSCHEDTVYDGLLDDHGRCADGITDALADADRENAGDRL